jgi:ketosteroid isomerase-like protein
VKEGRRKALSIPDVLELGDRLFRAICSGDLEAVREIYAPGIKVWRNFDRVEQTREENLRVLAWVTKNVAELRYEQVRRQRTESGFVQQHVLRGTLPGGDPLEVAACLVCRVEGGHITRIDEYLDSAAIAPLLRPGR